MADLGDYVPATLTHIFPLVLSTILYKPKISRLNKFNLGIFIYASLESPIVRYLGMVLDSVCVQSIPATYLPTWEWYVSATLVRGNMCNEISWCQGKVDYKYADTHQVHILFRHDSIFKKGPSSIEDRKSSPPWVQVFLNELAPHPNRPHWSRPATNGGGQALRLHHHYHLTPHTILLHAP